MDFILFLIRIIVYLILIVGPIGVIYLLIKIRQTSKVIEDTMSREFTLLRILVPKQNEKTPLAAEEMFAAIHGIYRLGQASQDYLSFELSARDQYIQFFCYVPQHLKDFIEGQIYAQYPTVEISEVQDYTDVDLTNWSMAGAELNLTKPDYYPIKTFVNFQVDPLAGITSVLSKISEGEQIWIQVLMRPVADVWQEKTLEYVKKIEKGEKPKDNSISIAKILKGTAGVVTDIARTAAGIGSSEGGEEKKEEKESLPGPVVEALRAAESKTTKLGFETIIRVAAIAKDEASAANKINNLVGAFKQYNVGNMNGFTVSKIATEKEAVLPIFQSRAFPTNGYIFNVEELASIYHLPSISVETPSIVWAGAKKGEPPANLPIEGLTPNDDVTLFAQTNYRHFNHRFGIKTADRRYHMYAIGKTGTGKSTMLRNMIIDDIQKGRGVCVVDPHGDLIQHVLDFIPDNRVDDVIYFNPADREHPVGFNLLESVDPDLKSIVASGLMSIFTKLWANVWSARMEYILRNAVLALLEYPNATLLEIMKLLVDPVFRRKVLFYVKDPVIRDFFINEFEKYEPKFRTEAIAPIQNKVGQFLSSSTIRNIMGQEKSTIEMREIMDSGKILLVDLSVGKIGEDNAALLGSMIITKIQLAAMGRADTSEEDRKDFYLYVDEFQNFATESFAVILSEARKYHLNLIITHQYIAQMPEIVASAVFGNVGTIVAFRVGAGDGGALAREFEPVFTANDLVNLDNYHIYLKMAIDARTATPFSAVTLAPFSGKNENRDKVIQQSIDKYTVKREDIELKINLRNEANSGKVGTFVEVNGEVQYQEEMKPYEPMNPLPKNFTFDTGEVWKIRDQDGKPFFVTPFDYDRYMDAKGKPTDRPGAIVLDPENEQKNKPDKPQSDNRPSSGGRDQRDQRREGRDNRPGRESRDNRENRPMPANQNQGQSQSNSNQRNQSVDRSDRRGQERGRANPNNRSDSRPARPSVIQPPMPPVQSAQQGTPRNGEKPSPQSVTQPPITLANPLNIVRHQNKENQPAAPAIKPPVKLQEPTDRPLQNQSAQQIGESQVGENQSAQQIGESQVGENQSAKGENSSQNIVLDQPIDSLSVTKAPSNQLPVTKVPAANPQPMPEVSHQSPQPQPQQVPTQQAPTVSLPAAESPLVPLVHSGADKADDKGADTVVDPQLNPRSAPVAPPKTNDSDQSNDTIIPLQQL